jgi:hypothetical protein
LDARQLEQVVDHSGQPVDGRVHLLVVQGGIVRDAIF